jgi:hypothetical protein
MTTPLHERIRTFYDGLSGYCKGIFSDAVRTVPAHTGSDTALYSLGKDEQARSNGIYMIMCGLIAAKARGLAPDVIVRRAAGGLEIELTREGYVALVQAMPEGSVTATGRPVVMLPED